MKKLIYLICSGLLFTIVSCDKGDMEIKTMNRGEGIWFIESIVTETYDSLGVNVIATNTDENPGDLVFFTSPTMNALFSHHMVVANMKDASGNVSSNPGDVYYDGDRVFFGEDPDPGHNFPDDLEGLWTITENKRRKQVWTVFALSGTGELAVKRTMNLKKK